MINHNSQQLNMAGEWVISLFHVQEVLGLNLKPNTTYPDFFLLLFSQVCPCKCRNSTSKGTAASFHILSNLLFNYHPTI
jgi:hypothetical protein